MGGVATSTAPRAPDRLELIRTFVNSLDLEAGVDSLADPQGWRTWAVRHDLDGHAAPGDLERLRGLREGIREALVANHDRAPLPERTRSALDAALRWSGAHVEVTASGLRLRPVGEGPTHLAGSVVAAAATGLADGTWSRLKACRDDTCRWAFYDRSRSRTGQWCSMEVCGNRNKQARWRQRSGSEVLDETQG